MASTGDASVQALMRADSDGLGNMPPGVSPSRFKQAMRHLGGTACVITVADGAIRGGMTATSVVSVAAEPAEILVAVNQGSSCWPLLERSGRFGVNLLSCEQQALAMQFAGVGGLKGEARYAGFEWRETLDGVSLLAQAPAALACEVADVWVRHSHALVVGRVTAIHMASAQTATPLLYWQGQYGSFLPNKVGAG